MAAAFPYQVRPAQESILKAVHERTVAGGALLLDAATGTGKTVSVLTPLIVHALGTGHRVLYLVRTHSQQTQVMAEVKAIARRLERPLLAVGLEGRQGRCLLLEDQPEMGGATAEEYGKLCSDRKRATEKQMDPARALPTTVPAAAPHQSSRTVDMIDLEGCPYYARVLSADLVSIEERMSADAPHSGTFNAWSREQNLCPYELAKKLCRRAHVVVAPYVFFFNAHIRRSLLEWMGVPLSEVDVVVDEAHNLPEHLRDLSTLTLSEESVRRARTEVTERGDFLLESGLGALRFLEALQRSLGGIVEECAGEEDGLLPPGILQERLLGDLGGTSQRLDQAMQSLLAWGEALREDRRRARQLPRSYVRNVALALLAWGSLEPPEFVKVALRQPARALEAHALDASAPASPLKDVHLSVHMSGTLAPLDEYRDTLGLDPATVRLSVPSPFPADHRRLLYSRTVSTRHEELRGDPDALKRLVAEIARTLRALPVKTAVFFPSFSLLDRLLALGLSRDLPPGSMVETRGLSTADLWRMVEGFKRASGASVLLGVCGGRVAEGIDFPDEELEAVVLVGIPYPAPNARRQALMRYLDLTTGRGWEYTMVAPAQRAMLQALGRMIRSETDRGLGIILDHRAPQFSAVLPGLIPADELPTVAQSFYRTSQSARKARRSAPSALPRPVTRRP